MRSATQPPTCHPLQPPPAWPSTRVLLSGSYQDHHFISEMGGKFASAASGHRGERVVPNRKGTATSFQRSVLDSGLAHPMGIVPAPNGGLLVTDWGTGITAGSRPCDRRSLRAARDCRS